MKIVLMGYMASGKSAIGKLLASKMRFQYVDLDTVIEMNENVSISEIFKTKGEIYFRKMESVYLKKMVTQNENVVISLGGGTPCYGNNIQIIEENTVSVYLKASINTLFERLKNETSKRPIVSEIGLENLKEFIAKHLFERNVYYENATFSVNTDAKTLQEIVSEVLDLIKSCK